MQGLRVASASDVETRRPHRTGDDSRFAVVSTLGALSVDEVLLTSVLFPANMIVVALYERLWIGFYAEPIIENVTGGFQHDQAIQLCVSRCPLNIVDVVGSGL